MTNYLLLIASFLMSIVTYWSAAFRSLGIDDIFPDNLCVRSKFFKNYLFKPKHKVSIIYLFWHLMELFGFIVLSILYIVFGSMGKISIFSSTAMIAASCSYMLFFPLPLIIVYLIIYTRYEKTRDRHHED